MGRVEDLPASFCVASSPHTVTLQDGIGRQSSVGFGVIRDTTPPTLTLEAVVQRTDVHVTWSATDPSPGSGLDTSTCRLEVREDEGTCQTFSTECGGEDATHDGEPGHTYTFRLTASDNVGNADSLEVQAVVPYVIKYYYANGQRVAMWQGDVVYYVHTDHLGSTSVLSDESGQQAGERVAYLPYGGVRLGDASTLPTDYTFTGQRNEAGIGLLHYGARFYSPKLGRFVSADSIVPQPGEPQALNRYAYVVNNPLRYTDPSGHYEFERDPDDPYVWYSDKPANTWIRCADPVDFPEEFHQPTTGEVVRVVTAPFAAATVMAVASVMTAQFVVNGALGTAGYTGGVVLTNAYGEGKLSLEGGSWEDAAASFITGGTTSVIPGEGFGPGFARGAAQAGSSYALGQSLKGEPLSAGETAASTFFGGLGGGVGDIAPGYMEKLVQKHISVGAAAATGKVGGVVAGPTADATFNLVKEQFIKSLQNPSPSPPWTWPTTPYTLP